MAKVQGPGYSALSKGRYSSSGEQYFLTVNLARPQTGLTEPALLAAVRREWARLGEARLWEVRTAVVMPDHLHLLVRLRAETEVGDVIRLFKGRLATALRPHGLSWQRSFYDHRLRHGEDAFPVFRYIFLNPYRAGLLAAGESWPGYFCGDDDWEWFRTLTDEGTPFPEWLEGR